MHFLKNLFTTLFALLCCYFLQAKGYGDRIDSVFNQMSSEQRISQLVWVAASETMNASEVLAEFGGIYYDQPLEAAIEPSAAMITVQVDRRMNPLPAEMPGLPDLYTLSAISKSDLLSTYFYFLRSNSRAAGIDHMVLPEPDKDSRAQRDLLRKMVAFDPWFFIPAGELSFQETKRRKDIEKIFASKNFWVVGEPFLEKAKKGLKKFVKRNNMEGLEYHIKEALATQLDSVRNTEIREIPRQLAVAISKASIIPVQRMKGMLPLETDTVCLVTREPYGTMANMLRKYAYVITTEADILRSQSPVIIHGDPGVSIPNISQNRRLIYVGSLADSKLWVDQMHAGLIYTIDSDIYAYVIPQQLFGASEVSGTLPVVDNSFWEFDNTPIADKAILGYAPPVMTGLDDHAMERIHGIVDEAIATGCTPGCQLAVALDGAIILDEAYGYLTYDSLVPVEKHTLFDVASVTKVSATLLAVMKLFEEGALDLDKSLKDYLPAYANSNKADITIRSILAHNAGLRPYVPFWRKTLSADRLETFYYASDEDRASDKRSYGVRPKPVLKDSLQNWILSSSLLEYDSVPFYSYSDIGFMILQQVVEEITQKTLEEYVYHEFYAAMGIDRLAFNPREKGFDLFEIAPTEYDYYFRDELVWGDVHDRNAAVFGGVAGHAGLFANAESLLVILQTMLQEGKYAEKQFLSPMTIDYFNRRYFPNNRRALGWDKKDDTIGNVSHYTSDFSFGHTGFTGTMVWVDPTFDLAFVFLSNRVYPNANNYKLVNQNIRTRIQDVVYEAILTKWMH